MGDSIRRAMQLHCVRSFIPLPIHSCDRFFDIVMIRRLLKRRPGLLVVLIVVAQAIRRMP
jgi:hypothetical protein